MKKLIPLLLFVAIAFASKAQTVSFAITHAPCNNDGILGLTFTGVTPPLTVQYTTYGSTGTTITHTGVSGLTDALTGYSGGPVTVSVHGDSSTFATGYYNGAPPFTYHIYATAAHCPALGTDSVAVTGGTAPYTYQWYNITSSSVVGTSNPVHVPTGLYGVTITDAAGCVFGSRVSMYDSGYVPYVSPFGITVSSTTANCTDGTASVTGTTGAPTLPLSYHWSTGATTPGITGLVTSAYAVSVTDAVGCVDSAYTYVPQSITITAPITTTPATCTASDGAVAAFGAGGTPPYTYLWSNGATTASQTGLPIGTYRVAVTDANGCIGSSSAFVNATTPITVAYSSTPSLCTSPTGTSTLAVTGGTLPYSITWITTPVQTGATASTLQPGNYTFHVTDAAGCMQSGTVTVPPVDVISATYTATNATCAAADGTLHAYPTGGVLPYTYLWSTGATGATLSGVPAGTYHLTITDAVGCTLNTYSTISRNSPMGVGLTSTPASCIFAADGSIHATPYGGTMPYTYSWTGGGSSSTLSGLRTGPYWVTVTDAAGCTANSYAYVSYDASNTSCYCTIEGTIYKDTNNNCVQDAGEAGINHVQVNCTGIGYTYTDASGHYSFIVPSGSYTISETVQTFYPLATCQANNIPVTVSAGTGCSHTINFANTVDTVHDMHISTWDYTLAVPGHTYNHIAIVTNEGTVDEDSVVAGYKPDGQFFSPLFVPSGILSGSSYWYHTTTGSFPSLIPGNSQTLNMAYSVPASIPLGTNVVFKDSVSHLGPINNWLTDYTPWNNVNYFNTTVVSSFDPNFKEVSPKGTGASGLITYADSVLEYMVHFQNTGTFMAENITVIDTLDDNLDWTSLHPVYQSAPCKVMLTQSGTRKIATFSFPHIDLSAQSVNDISSNGLFTYTIKLRPGLAAGTQIRNHASIYFDYNAPVTTNATLNTLGSSGGGGGGGGTGTGVGSVTETAGKFAVYPNPAANSFSAIINSDNITVAQLAVTDISGKTLLAKTVALQKGGQVITTDVSLLAPGVYFVTLQANGTTQTQKLIIVK